MRYTICVLGLIAALFSAYAFGQSTDPAQNIRDARVTSPAYQAILVNEAHLHQLIRSMNSEMALLKTIDDTAERERIMDMHRSHLHETLMLLRVTAGASMNRLLENHDQAVGLDDPDETPDQKIARLELRMDMMQMLMESMLDHMTMHTGRS